MGFKTQIYQRFKKYFKNCVIAYICAKHTSYCNIYRKLITFCMHDSGDLREDETYDLNVFIETNHTPTSLLTSRNFSTTFARYLSKC